MTTTQPAALPERFTKKPVTIEAVQFRNDGSSYALIQWINEGQHAAGRRFASWQNHEIIVPTLEGEHIASPGDWIIKGVKGEFYPCKPDIFEMTYDLAALQSQPAAAGVSDADIAFIAQQHWPDATNYGFATHIAFARAILALRPQASATAAEQEGPRAYLICGGRLYKDQAVMGLSVAEDRVATRGDGSRIEPLYTRALRPQAVPMTPEQVKQAVRFFRTSTPRDVDEWVESIIRYTEEFRGITAQGAQGGEG